MKIFSANIQSLQELYNSELRKALDLEEQIVKALPTMIEKSSDTQLKQAFQSHLQESETHVDKVKQLLSQQEDSSSQTCKVIHALVTEAQDTIKDVNDPDVLDVALIGAGQQVEHHEMAVYGTLQNWARLLGRHQDAQILESILNDEKHADKLLSQVADRVNSDALVAA
ncbi:ferritin-like domain-containing protein [Terriglobus sp.]|uniref:YciE/YciF ferroxidase family protein n=1 Tax=Terriglobus sp. TaxID=1889013 RepID=UPI003B004824